MDKFLEAYNALHSHIFTLVVILLLCISSHRNLKTMQSCIYSMRLSENHGNEAMQADILQYKTARSAFVACTTIAWVLVFFGNYLF